MMRNESTISARRLISNPRLPGLLTYLGQVIFMASTAFVVARKENQEIAAIADPLAGAAVIIAVPMALLVAIYWRSLPGPGSAAPPLPAPAARAVPHHQEGGS
jgi:hypothetical protein